MKTESQIKEMIHRIGNYPNAIGAGEKQALEWVLNTDESAMCEANSNAVLGDVALSQIKGFVKRYSDSKMWECPICGAVDDCREWCVMPLLVKIAKDNKGNVG